jgi:hypothetical protein
MMFQSVDWHFISSQKAYMTSLLGVKARAGRLV